MYNFQVNYDKNFSCFYVSKAYISLLYSFFKGYYQLDLFEKCNMKLEILIRTNQKM